LKVHSPDLKIKIRRDFPGSMEEAKYEIRELGDRIGILAEKGGSLVEIKRLTERYEFLHYVVNDLFRTWTGLNYFGLAGKMIKIPVFLLRLGDSVVAGLPGEPFGEFSAALRKQTCGNSLIVAEECNGYLSYIPDTSAYPLGSYGPNAAVCDENSEKSIVEQMLKHLKKISKKVKAHKFG
jgi:hypothetical protein